MSMLMIMPVNAHAVENGTDATNDPNAVMIDGGYSGFLYSPRIVLTVAHGLEYGQSKETVRRVGYPGKVGYLGQFPSSNYVNSVKIFWAPNYQSRTSTNWSRIGDFAVIVLESPMEMNNKVRIATAEDVQRYMNNKTTVNLVGYGRQKDRRNPDQQGSVEIYPNKLFSRILTETESNQVKTGLPPGVMFTSDINFEQKPGQPSVCDGDSGAGWFVEENGFRNYIGAGSSGWGMSNCGHMGFWDPNGSLASVSAAYQYIDLIKEAEKYIQEHPYAEKQIGNTITKTSQTKLLCIKNKTKKYVTSKKCPKGYKLVKKVA